ncbi:MAG TPA: multiheme c-type cytochrome [Puia sp.]|nr:multiheme c-type cytochrome [Puia sp.]
MPAVKKYHFTLLLIPAIFLLSAHWKPPAPTPQDRTPNPYDTSAFIGSAACQSCHKDIYAAYIHTAHYLDSRPAAEAFIKGSFKGDKGRFVLNEHMEVRMETKAGRFYQTALLNGNPFESEAFGIVIGSGRKGQTYLYWDGNRLFQLPVSYFVPLDSWCNSPGYPRNMVYFGKQVHGQCLECHGTHAKMAELADLGTVFDSTSILYGIDCERCHGPAAQHVAWQAAHPTERTAKYIINTRHLSRQQRLDACALCHSGFRDEKLPSFSFTVGDTLDNYSTATYDTSATAALDVHGNQYGLLTASKCFRLTDRLDCSSCHDPHVNEHAKMDVYSQRCVNCHNGNSLHSCSFPPVRTMGLTNNCIDCHMPALPSNAITLQLSGQAQLVHDLVRTHRVAIYPDATKAYLEKIKRR